MVETLKIKNFAFVFPSRKKAEDFLKALNKLVDEHEVKKDDCFFTYYFE
jgi:hypothetical protein